MIPDFVDGQNLPRGMYECTWEELIERFGKGHRRSQLCNELKALIERARSCDFLKVIVDGSFVTAKETPGDLDILWVVKRGTTKDIVSEDCAKLLDGTGSKQQFGHDMMYCPDEPASVATLADGLGFDLRTGKDRGVIVLTLQ